MFASRANSWISPVTEKDRVLKLTKTTKHDNQHSELKQSCWLGWKTKKKVKPKPPEFSLQDTHLHILQCQALSAAPPTDRKPGSSTCHRTEDSHNSFHSRINVQVDVVAEKKLSTSDSTSTI